MPIQYPEAAPTSLPNTGFSPEPKARSSKLQQMRNIGRLLLPSIGVLLLAIMPVADAQQPVPNGWIEGKIFDEQTGQPLVDWVQVRAVPDDGPEVIQTLAIGVSTI